MTLPHRIGYSVPSSTNKKKPSEQSAPLQQQQQQQQQPQNVPDTTKTFPPFGVPPHMLQSMTNDNNLQMVPPNFSGFPLTHEGLGVSLATPSMLLPPSTELRFTLERPVGQDPLAFNFVPTTNGANGAPLKTLSNAGEGAILPPEEVLARRQYVVQHRLFPSVMELLMSCKKDNILPAIENLATLHELTGASDFGLDDFLQAQGIETTPLASNEDVQKVNDRAQFILKLEQLKDRYKEQLDRLNKICDEYSARMFLIMREQSTLRPVLDKEMQFKLLGLQQKFDYLRNQLRQTVCNSVISLQKQYNQERKKRKSLSKKATELLSQWFFAHINDPYPSEEEKIMLAASGNLTIAQVNYWFGNKRIRYKRKCLEEESHTSININSLEGGHPSQQTAQVTMSQQAQPPQPPQHPIAQSHAPAPQQQQQAQLPAPPETKSSKKAAQPRASKNKKESAKDRKAEQKAKETSRANQNMAQNNNHNMNAQNNAHMMNMAQVNQLNQMNHPLSHQIHQMNQQMNQLNQMNQQMGHQPMSIPNQVLSEQHMIHMPHMDDSHMMNMAHMGLPFNIMGMGMMGIPVSMGVPNINMGFYPVQGQHPNGMQLPHVNAMMQMQGVHPMMMEPPRDTDTHSFLV